MEKVGIVGTVGINRSTLRMIESEGGALPASEVKPGSEIDKHSFIDHHWPTNHMNPVQDNIQASEQDRIPGSYQVTKRGTSP
jgi:hypothetical protein